MLLISFFKFVPMKLFVAISLFFLVCSQNTTFAHKFYFGFAELEYNEMQEKFEGTLIFTAHDLEEYLMQQKVIDSKFEKLSHDSTTNEILGKSLFQNFELFFQNNRVKLTCLDFFLTRNGLIEIYFSSEKIAVNNEISIHFSSLMDYFPEQQNKITFIKNNKKSSVSFLPNEGIKTIKLEN